MLNSRNIAGLIELFGGSIQGGINWTWAYFDNRFAAYAFHTAITSDPSIETRGVYEPHDYLARWGVRYR